eukprot:CAMPEP_0118856402 /NCGR_PEP_ID=MMETSP1163-20130328/3887_1 /TAXON_ID=124430 /ORGANISM="Phaeomonas parva, Strain CCMP2877" /LENGTH=82 /DNA_ID=CAMNT_0006789495 /DNA_START=238 /DNA_END=483 /DNA_ORIENTATION=-
MAPPSCGDCRANASKLELMRSKLRGAIQAIRDAKSRLAEMKRLKEDNEVLRGEVAVLKAELARRRDGGGNGRAAAAAAAAAE